MSANHTEEIIDELYEFMQIPYDLDAQNTTLGYLMHGESHATHGQYYALFRDREFDPNHWTKELSREVLINKFIALFSCQNNSPIYCSMCLKLKNGAVELYRNWDILLSTLQPQMLPLSKMLDTKTLQEETCLQDNLPE